MACTDVDFKGVVYGTQLSIHFMRKNPVPGGKIIATASVAGIYPHESYPEYNGAKAAVINFARGAAPVLKLVSATHLPKSVRNCLLTVSRKKIFSSIQSYLELFPQK